MAHHGSDLMDFSSDDLRNAANMGFEQIFNQVRPKPELGATGKFPDGKISDDDEGEIKIGITEKDGTVIIDFGKSIAWIGFTKEQAKSIAFSLQHKAGFSMWEWMKSWLGAWEKANPEKGVSAESIINWMNEQPTSA